MHNCKYILYCEIDSTYYRQNLYIDKNVEWVADPWMATRYTNLAQCKSLRLELIAEGKQCSVRPVTLQIHNPV